MATKSILKSITISNNQSCNRLLGALEKNAAKPRKDKPISKRVATITDHDIIRGIFKK